MTEQHPLTDELCDQIVSSTPPLPCDPQDRVLSYDGRILDGMFEECFEEQKHEMRASADWQLEQVIEWLKDNLQSWYLTPDGYSGFKIDVDEVVYDLEEAMRPTTTRGQQLMTEAQWALFTVLDGYQRHDLYDIMAGLDEEEVSRVWAAYQEACNLYNKNEDNS